MNRVSFKSLGPSRRGSLSNKLRGYLNPSAELETECPEHTVLDVTVMETSVIKMIGGYKTHKVHKSKRT